MARERHPHPARARVDRPAARPPYVGVDRLHHAVELRIDARDESEPAVDDPHSSSCDGNPRRRRVQWNRPQDVARRRIDPRQGPVAGIADPNAADADRYRAWPDADRHFVDDLVGSRVDDSDVVRMHERQAAAAGATEQERREPCGEDEAEEGAAQSERAAARALLRHPWPREAIGEPVDLELEKGLRHIEVFQGVGAKSAHTGALGEQSPGSAREQDLTPVRGGPDSSCAGDGETDVPVALEFRLSRMKPHSHLDLRAVRPLVRRDRALRICGGGHRVAHPREDREKGLRLPVDDQASVRLDRLLEQTPVLVDDFAIALLEPVLKLGRSLDVREEERDGAAG